MATFRALISLFGLRGKYVDNGDTVFDVTEAEYLANHKMKYFDPVDEEAKAMRANDNRPELFSSVAGSQIEPVAIVPKQVEVNWNFAETPKGNKIKPLGRKSSFK